MFPIRRGRSTFGALDGSRFEELDPGSEEEIPQPRAQPRIGALPAKGFSLPLPERDQFPRLIDAAAVIRLGERQDVRSRLCNALHLEQSLQRIIHPEQEKMTVDNV